MKATADWLRQQRDSNMVRISRPSPPRRKPGHPATPLADQAPAILRQPSLEQELGVYDYRVNHHPNEDDDACGFYSDPLSYCSTEEEEEEDYYHSLPESTITSDVLRPKHPPIWAAQLAAAGGGRMVIPTTICFGSPGRRRNQHYQYLDHDSRLEGCSDRDDDDWMPPTQTGISAAAVEEEVSFSPEFPPEDLLQAMEEQQTTLDPEQPKQTTNDDAVKHESNNCMDANSVLTPAFVYMVRRRQKLLWLLFVVLLVIIVLLSVLLYHAGNAAAPTPVLDDTSTGGGSVTTYTSDEWALLHQASQQAKQEEEEPTTAVATPPPTASPTVNAGGAATIPATSDGQQDGTGAPPVPSDIILPIAEPSLSPVTSFPTIGAQIQEVVDEAGGEVVDQGTSSSPPPSHSEEWFAIDATEPPTAAPFVVASAAGVVEGDGDVETLARDRCACADCTNQIWNTLAGNEGSPGGRHSCGNRIEFLQQAYPKIYQTQADACRQVAFEYPCECGACDPARCRANRGTFVEVMEHWNAFDSAHNQEETVTAMAVSEVAPMYHRSATLHCFPDNDKDRVEYKLWSNMIVQVKQGWCDPAGNLFDADNVKVSGNDLALRYANGKASEVRILLPPNRRPYSYGKYEFRIKSVRVLNGNKVLSRELPQELVFGMFTWNPYEDYSKHENWNHEVDIEISKWNCPENADGQFVVQPPGYPQMHRFFTGKFPKSYDPSGTYSLTWQPSKVHFKSTAGGGQNFVLQKNELLQKTGKDLIQCMPGTNTGDDDVEVRINLWNMLGGNKALKGYPNNAIVEVVISNFVYRPFADPGSWYLRDGQRCTQDCKCRPKSRCVRGKCQRQP